MGRIRRYEADCQVINQRPRLDVTQVTTWSTFGVGVQWHKKMTYATQSDGPSDFDSYTLAETRRTDFVTPFSRATGQNRLTSLERRPAMGAFDIQPALNYCAANFVHCRTGEAYKSMVFPLIYGAFLGQVLVGAAGFLIAHPTPTRVFFPSWARETGLSVASVSGGFYHGSRAFYAQWDRNEKFRAKLMSMQQIQMTARLLQSGRQGSSPTDLIEWWREGNYAKSLGGAPRTLHAHTTAYLKERGVDLGSPSVVPRAEVNSVPAVD